MNMSGAPDRPIGFVARHVLPAFALLLLVVAGCSGGSEDTCGGIIEPVRLLTPSPTSLTLDVGADSQVTASPSGGCATDDRTVRWQSSDALIASVSPTGKVTAVAGGTVTLTATSFSDKAQTSIVVTVRPKVATTIDARPDVDTLSPLGTRALTAVVRDQGGAVLPNAPVVWRSLALNIASVTVGGVVTAIANGTASVVATTPRVGADSLRDTVRIEIVTACDLVRPVQLGATFSASIDASTCQNLYGYRVANQYSVTAAAQAYFSIRLAATTPTALVPLNISSGLFGLPVSDTAVTAFVVIRPGTFGFLVTAPTQAPGTYTVTTTVNPDPRLACVTTDVTTGVNFQTAITPSCPIRDIRILPALAISQQVRITGTAAGFPVSIELLNFVTRAVIVRATATAAGGTATINFLNTQNRFGLLRVTGGANVNDLVTITVAP